MTTAKMSSIGLDADSLVLVGGTRAFTGAQAGLTAAVDTNTTQLATTAFILAQMGRLQAPADHAWEGITASLTAHENFAAFQVGFLNASGEMALTDADAAATMPVVGMATAAISADAAGRFLLFGIIRDESWGWTPGGALYASGTAGAITHTAPTTTGKVVQVVAWAISAKIILFNPSNIWIELT